MKQQEFKTTFSVYKTVEIIGEGGSGRVYKVTDADDDAYALKLLNPSMSGKTNRTLLKRFKNEIAYCQRNSHKNIVSVVDHGYIEIDGAGYPFYVMPYYPSTLRDLMKDGLKPDDVLMYFFQVLDGVRAAHHQKIWHRDLKPENILHDPYARVLLVADFGIAHFSEDQLQTSLVTAPNSRLANFQYAAPEQRERGKAVDHRADIFALGLMLNEMFTGKVIQGTGYATIAGVAPDYAYLDEIVDAMVRQTPDERPEMIDKVERWIIAARSLSASRKQLGELGDQEIRELEFNDPLIETPVELKRVDLAKGRLLFVLNQEVTSRWAEAFCSIQNYSFMSGFEPRLFHFSGDLASIQAINPDQKEIDMFKDYLVKANAKYVEDLKRELRQKEIEEQNRLRAKIEEEMKRQQFLKTIKI